LKGKRFIALLASIFLIVVLVATGCIVNAASIKQVETAQVLSAASAQIDKSWNALSPRGIQLPVQIKPLAPRLDTFDGKTIYIVQGEADPIIMPALNDRMQKDYPNTKWNYYQPSSSFGPTTPDDQTKAEAKAVIRGNSW
jgi:hypothetical protein